MLRRRRQVVTLDTRLLDTRTPGELRFQAELLLTLRETIFGPPVFGDTYANLLAALQQATEGRAGLTRLLLELGVSDVEDLIFLFRTVSIDTAVQTLAWAANPDAEDLQLMAGATLAHPILTEAFRDD